MSLCDTCIEPGHCCKQIGFYAPLPIRFAMDEPIDAQLRKYMAPDDPEPPWHIDVICNEQTDQETGRITAEVGFSCPLLTEEGRCGDYDRRPNVCRIFKPGADRLCVHYTPEIEAEDIKKELSNSP